MNFLARIVRFLFWLLVLSWSLRLLRRIVGGMLRNDTAPGPQAAEASNDTPTAARRLVRDPVCGMHVDETRTNRRAAVGVSIEASAESEEHTSELQSRFDLVCRLLL